MHRCMCMHGVVYVYIVFNPNWESIMEPVYCKVANCTTWMQPYFKLNIFTAFLCQSTSPKKQRAVSQSTPVNKNNANAHYRTNKHTDTAHCFCISPVLSLFHFASLCFTSASPTRNRNTEHEIRALHEYTVNTI